MREAGKRELEEMTKQRKEQVEKLRAQYKYEENRFL